MITAHGYKRNTCCSKPCMSRLKVIMIFGIVCIHISRRKSNVTGRNITRKSIKSKDCSRFLTHIHDFSYVFLHISHRCSVMVILSNMWVGQEYGCKILAFREPEPISLSFVEKSNGLVILQGKCSRIRNNTGSIH